MTGKMQNIENNETCQTSDKSKSAETVKKSRKVDTSQEKRKVQKSTNLWLKTFMAQAGSRARAGRAFLRALAFRDPPRSSCAGLPLDVKV